MLDFSGQIKSFEKNDLVFSLYFFIYFYREDSETNSLLRFENFENKSYRTVPYPVTTDRLSF